MPLNTEVDYNNVVIKGTVELGVKGERGLQGFKGDQGIQGIQGPPVPVANELGDDPDIAVSQKLLTDSIADKADKVAGYSLVDDDEITKLSTVEQDAQKNTVSSVAGRQGDVLLDKSDVGLGAVDNTSDADKPVSDAVTAALEDKLNKPPSDGVLYGVRNGVFVPIMAGSTAQA